MKNLIAGLTLLCLLGCSDGQKGQAREFDRRMDEQVLRYQTGDIHVAKSALQSIIALHDEFEAKGVEGIYVSNDYSKIKGLSEIRLGLVFRRLNQPEKAEFLIDQGVLHYGFTNQSSREKVLNIVDVLDRNMKVKWGVMSSQSPAGDAKEGAPEE